MKFNRRHLVVASVWTLSFGSAVALVACGGDTIGDTGTTSDSGSGTGNDATTGTGEPGDATPVDATPISIIDTGDDGGNDGAANDAAFNDAAFDAADAADAAAFDASAAMTIYAGQTATLTGTLPFNTTGATFVWTLTSAPPGSAITTASIGNATSAVPSLPTDKAGAYVLSVAATVNGVTQTVSITVTAVAAHVVYGVDDSDAGTSGLSVIDTNGANGHAVICPFVTIAGGGPFPGQSAAKGALGVVDTREGAPGTATKIVFAGLSQYDASTAYSTLYITDTNGTCPTGGDAGANAVGLETASGAVGGFGYANVAHPRLSPDATKVAFTASTSLNDPDTTSTVNVVNVDGTSPVSLGLIDEDGGRSGDDYVATLRQPEWTTATPPRVGWPRAESTGWEIVTSAVPAGNGDPAVFMTCALAPVAGLNAPARAVFLASGSVLTLVQFGAATQLVVLTPDATSKVCAVTHNLSGLSDAGASVVEAFALSPDGTTVAFAANDPAENDAATTRYVLYTVPVDGSSSPKRVGASDEVDQQAGVRWIAGGAQLAFTHSTDAGIQTIAATLVADSGIASDLFTGDAGVTVTAVGSGDRASCSFGGKSSPMLAFFGGALALLGLARSRSRRSRRVG